MRSLIQTSALPLVFLTAALWAQPGDLDPSFGDGGRVFIDFVDDTDAAASVILQPDGKFLVGRANDAADDDFSVVRLKVDGTLDMSFGRSGRTALDLPDVKGTTHVVLRQADGRIVAAGEARNVTASDGSDFGLARYNEDGSVDATFGVDGVALRDLGGWGDAIHALVQQADGRLVAAGKSDGGGGASSTSDIALVRFEADGSLDRSFGVNGAVVINFHGSNGPDQIHAVVQQPDGKLVAAGSAAPSNPYSSEDMVVVRLLPDGQPDTSFGDQGLLAVELGDPSGQGAGQFAWTSSVALAPGGQIVLAGSGSANAWDYGFCAPVMVRLNADGTSDATFGTQGTRWLDLSCAYLDDLVPGANGALFVAGSLYGAGSPYAADQFVTRVLPDGSLDASFGIDGVAIIDGSEGGEFADSGNAALIVDANGRIVTVASTVPVSSTGDRLSDGTRLIVARLLADGAGPPGILGLGGIGSGLESEVARIAVRRTGGSTDAVGVDYTTRSGTATSGTDFTPSAGSLTWADGDRAEKTIEVSLAADSETEGVETFFVELGNPSGGAILAGSRLEVAITEEVASPGPPSAPQSPPGGGGGGLIDWMTLLAAICLLAGRRAEVLNRIERPAEPT